MHIFERIGGKLLKERIWKYYYAYFL